MKTIITDIEKEEFKKLDSNYKVFNSLKCNKSCMACFSCWIKTPNVCIINDNFDNLSSCLIKTDELIIISKMRYGCYSASVKKLLERCIGYVNPLFEMRDKMMHHKMRCNNNLKLSVYFYGSKITKEDKMYAEELVKKNAINLNAKSYEVNFINNERSKTNWLH